jgi:cytochrome oxidase assembly protein ShyY1
VARPAAVYDTVTEGLTGWQFLRTGRWMAYLAAAVVFALICGALALWQYDRGREASADNHLYSANFAAATVPLGSALPTTSSYSPDLVWRAVSMRGRWDAAHQYYVRNSVRSGETGFDVVTAFRLQSGATFLVDRGWVAASGNGTVPASRPAPPEGTVDLVARLRPSQAKRGEGGVTGHQIESVDLTELGPVVGGDVYSAAWGVIVSPRSSAQGLARIQATPPAEGVGYHYSYMIQWILFALIGFFLLFRGAVREYRRINADDPQEQEREAERVRRRARKAFSDEEIEDESLDGYLPLSRWTSRPGLPSRAGSGEAKPALTGTPIPFDAREPDDAPPADTPPPLHSQVLVLPPGDAGNETTADATRRERGSGEPDDAETGADGTVVDEADADEADADVTGATKQGSTPDPPSPSN